jgi:uncharacterized beta-barrel protein YwiB (DUF1934 family)
MKCPATINVIGSQNDGHDTSTVEITAAGTYETLPDGFKLTYEEYPDDNTLIKTVFTLGAQTVNINRSGSVTTNLIIEKSKHNICAYTTEIGDILIGTYGKELTLTDGGLKLEYYLDMNSSLVSRNTVEINYTLEHE